MNKRIQYRQMENLLKKMNEKIDSQNRRIESQSEILQEFIGLLNAKQREGEDFEKFLCIDEPLPEYRTPTGRLKKRKSVIGRKTSAHDSMNGILDVAMISSLGREDKINEIVKQYGMVIMDECHHAAAQIAQEVLNEVNAKYVYGLTATPKRDDGQEQKIFM